MLALIGAKSCRCMINFFGANLLRLHLQGDVRLAQMVLNDVYAHEFAFAGCRVWHITVIDYCLFP